MFAASAAGTGSLDALSGVGAAAGVYGSGSSRITLEAHGGHEKLSL